MRKVKRVLSGPSIAAESKIYAFVTKIYCSNHGRRRGEGRRKPLDFEIWCFAVSILVEKYFSLSFGVDKVKSTTVGPPRKNPFGHSVGESFWHHWQKSF